MLVQNGGAQAADYWIEASANQVSDEEAQRAFESSYGRMLYDHSFAAEWLAGDTAGYGASACEGADALQGPEGEQFQLAIVAFRPDDFTVLRLADWMRPR